MLFYPFTWSKLISFDLIYKKKVSHTRVGQLLKILAFHWLTRIDLNMGDNFDNFAGSGTDQSSPDKSHQLKIENRSSLVSGTR